MNYNIIIEYNIIIMEKSEEKMPIFFPPNLFVPPKNPATHSYIKPFAPYILSQPVYNQTNHKIFQSKKTLQFKINFK